MIMFIQRLKLSQLVNHYLKSNFLKTKIVQSDKRRVRHQNSLSPHKALEWNPNLMQDNNSVSQTAEELTKHLLSSQPLFGFWLQHLPNKALSTFRNLRPRFPLKIKDPP